ncbi:uncharacterized protein LOC128208882 [Mya arenaria]|nr:uncharacterized protein LOC128208882 [Mya arenaria]
MGPFLIVFGIIVSLNFLSNSNAAANITCDTGHYHHLDLDKCVECSSCNEEPVMWPCQGTKDTQCGILQFTFSDFSFMNSQSYGEVGSDGDGVAKAPRIMGSEAEERQWQTVAFVLIGMISFLVILATIVIIISCHKFRNYPWLCKTVTTETGDDAENGYVVIHRFMPPSASPPVISECSQPLVTPPTEEANVQTEPTHFFIQYNNSARRSRAYTPKRRLMNEYVDDVFESDDSSGSRTLSKQLAPIPEKSDQEEEGGGC